MSVSKSCFYNDCVSHPEADKTSMDALVINIITQALISRKITWQKKKNIIGRKRGPAKTIFGQKSGPAMAGPPTTALPHTHTKSCGNTLLPLHPISPSI